MDRGQAHTLEAFTAAMLLMGSILFALQATAVTPLSASTSNQHIENQQRYMASDILAGAKSTGSLQETVVFWNETASGDGRWHNSGELGVFSGGGPPTPFGESLNETFRDERIAFNVVVHYQNEDGDTARERLVHMGTPSDNAVSARYQVVLRDDTKLTELDGGDVVETDTNVSTAANTGGFYAPDSASDSALFNVLEVEIITWRM